MRSLFSSFVVEVPAVTWWKEFGKRVYRRRLV